MARRSVRVAITGFGGLDNPEPGTSVARALRCGWRGPLEIEALNYDEWTTGAWVPGLADRIHILPRLANGNMAILDRILEIHEEHPLDAMVPCLELEVSACSRFVHRLQRAGIKTWLPSPTDLEAVEKTNLPFFCDSNGIPVPKTIHVPDPHDLPFYADQMGYPLFVKGTIAGGKRVESREQAFFEGAALHAKWGNGAILQEPVEGEEYVVAMVARDDGSCLGMVPVRKLGVNGRGKGVIGVVVDDPDLKRESRRILSRFHWQGPLELEFVRSRKTNQFFLIEINPRFPSWILLSHFAGCNLPALMLREMLGFKRVRASSPRSGAAYVRDVEEIAVPLKRLERLKQMGTADGLAVKSNGHRSIPRRGWKVAVTGISSFDVVMAGLGVARCLRQAPEVERVYGLAYSPFDTGVHTAGLFDKTILVSSPGDRDALLQDLVDLKKKNGLDAVLPCLDGELELFVDLAAELKKMGVATLLPSPEALRRRRKDFLYRENRADWGGFQVPRTLRVRSSRQAECAGRTLGFPLVVKGELSGSATVCNLKQAQAVASAFSEAKGSAALFQPLITGNEFAVAAVCGWDHRMLDAVSVKKQVCSEGGKTWGAVRVESPGLLASVGAFLERLRWRGPVEMEFIREPLRERFMLIDVNPRFPAWIGYSADLGVNLPRVAVSAALGRPSPASASSDELLFVRACKEFPAKVHSFARFAGRRVLSRG